MSSIALIIKTPKLATDFAKSGQDKANMGRLLKLLNGIVSGAVQGSVYIQTSASDPVAAYATATITYANLAATDTIVILGTTLTCVTSAPSTAQFQKVTDATVTAANLAAAINAHATLSKYVTGSSALGVCTITVNFRGFIGNFLTVVTSTGTGFTLAQWTAGTGGGTTTPVAIRG